MIKMLLLPAGRHGNLSVSLLVILVAAFTHGRLHAQQQLGMRLERNAGQYGAVLNPSFPAFNPNKWEINLVAADLFVNNNYAYLQQTSVPHALKNTGKIFSMADASAENQPPRDAILQDFYDRERKMFVVTQTRVQGPGFAFKVGEDNTFGLVTALRAGFSAYRIPEIARYYTISDLPRNEQIDIPPVKIAGMGWAEIGVQYAHRFTGGERVVAIGITPKLLLGYDGFYLHARSDFDFNQQPNDTILFGKATWAYGVTTGNLTDDPDQVKARISGRGMGLDLGISIAQPAADPQDEYDYDWRIGASLVDLGYVRFNRQARRDLIQFDTQIVITNADFPPRDNATAILEDVSTAFLNNPQASLQANAFSMGLPTAISLQGDVKIMPHFYAGGVLVQRIPLSASSLRGPSTLAVVPRFEHRWVSISMPLVLSDWQFLRVGLAARLGVLYIGTDNLNSFVGQKKLTGTDLYVGLKINAFHLKIGKWSPGLNTGVSRRNWRKIKCYQF